MQELIKELLAVPEFQLLQHEKVVAAAEGLGIKTMHVQGRGEYPMSWTQIIPGSIADVAFKMKSSAKELQTWCDALLAIQMPPYNGEIHWCWWFEGETERHVIIAATLVWWEGQG